MTNALTPTSWFYSLYVHTSVNQIQRDYPSRLEISFLLDSGASISVLNYPTYVTIANLPNFKQNDSLNTSKTLIVANQTEVPILHYVTTPLNTTIEDDFLQFQIPFAEYLSNTISLVHLSLKTIYRIKTSKILHYISNINLEHIQIIQNLHHSCPKTIHISHI